jgi:phage protein D
MMLGDAQAVQIGVRVEAHVRSVVDDLQITGDIAEKMIQWDKGVAQGFLADCLTVQLALQGEQKR